MTDITNIIFILLLILPASSISISLYDPNPTGMREVAAATSYVLSTLCVLTGAAMLPDVYPRLGAAIIGGIGLLCSSILLKCMAGKCNQSPEPLPYIVAYSVTTTVWIGITVLSLISPLYL